MNESSSKQRGTPSNGPHDEDVFSMMLEAMSVAELNSALEEALENMTEENYDPALINAYLEALDRKDPIPEIPDAEAAYAGFQERLGEIFPGRDNKATTPIRKLHRAWRVGLVAALAIICMIGAMVVAEAAGLNVFGTMAQWTDTIFSLGAVRSEGAEDELNHPASGQTANGVDGDAEYETLQAALDAYGITEVSEPTWMPEGYALYNINVSCPSDGRLLFLSAHYTDGTSYLLIDIESYQDEPYAQIEKTDDPVETFEVNGLLVYLLENTNNNAAAWATEHYEYCVSGAVDKSVLRQIVLSAYGESGFDENG